MDWPRAIPQSDVKNSNGNVLYFSILGDLLIAVPIVFVTLIILMRCVPIYVKNWSG